MVMKINFYFKIKKISFLGKRAISRIEIFSYLEGESFHEHHFSHANGGSSWEGIMSANSSRGGGIKK